MYEGMAIPRGRGSGPVARRARGAPGCRCQGMREPGLVSVPTLTDL